MKNADLPPDFYDAHERHWVDAELLRDKERWANADHLYGFAAECGLKRLMLAFGMTLDASGKPSEREDRTHAKQIWKRYETYLNGNMANSYALSGEPFDDWDVNHRYAAQNHFERQRVEQHREGAERVRSLLKNAQFDGYLT